MASLRERSVNRMQRGGALVDIATLASMLADLPEVLCAELLSAGIRGKPLRAAEVASEGPAAKAGMGLIEFSPSAHGTRIGFCKIELPSGPTTDAAHVHRGPLGTPHAPLPSAPDIGRDGVQKRDPSGNRKWRSILRWRSKALQDG